MKLLLGRDDINPDRPNEYGETPLWSAAWNGHVGVVKLLLGRDNVNPDTPNNFGQTPFSCAVGNGHAGVIALLQSPTPTSHSTT